MILEREAIKWFKPAKGQFQIYYKNGADHPEYQPDFVVETETAIFMLEPKSKKELEDPIVVAKKEVAEKWCERASDYNAKHGGKSWEYALISHDKIAENMSIEELVTLKVQCAASQFGPVPCSTSTGTPCGSGRALRMMSRICGTSSSSSSRARSKTSSSCTCSSIFD